MIARPDHLGDVLLTLPAAVALRHALPNAQISYLVAAAMAAVPEHCPAVHQTIGVPFPPPTAPPSPAGWSEIVGRVAPGLRGRFDVAIVPRVDDPWSGAVVAAAGVPVRIGYASPRTRPFLTHALPLPERRHVAALALDLVTAALEAIAALDVTAALEALGLPARFEARGALSRSEVRASGAAEDCCFVPTPVEAHEVEAALAASGLPATVRPVVLPPGSGWPIKNWPPARWGALAAELARRAGAAPLVVGGPREGGLVDEVVDASGGRARGLASHVSLGGLAALHRRARLVIATDSGPLHLAALVGAPVVGLYGPADPAEFGPWCPAEQRRVVAAELPCSPCRTLVDPPCGVPVEPACVPEIAIEAVLAAATELLGT